MKWGLRRRLALRRLKQFRRSQQGQMSVMIAMMMTTFILFFCFVVNTGMLVNAKINLQNAADLAAYAGAATQARLLNQISYLNYEMRRQYKKFLFRYYVIGNMAQDGFPLHGGSGPPQWKPSNTDPTNYGIPTVCIMFNPSDNFCHLPALQKITIPPANPLDAIQTTLVAQLNGIEQIRQANCDKISDTNQLLLSLWLWNTDPGLDNLIAALGPNSGSARVVQGLAQGLGLIPKELILWSRIQTLKGYVNEPAQKQQTKETVDAILQGADPGAKERTVQAFYSAYFTLGNHTFNGSDVIMDELTPSDLLVLKDLKAKFSTFSIKFEHGPPPANCQAVAEEQQIPEFPVGVFKDRSIMTYYAIRLKAKAKVMFNPFGPDVELKAYSAAQPFGSRIGPVLTSADFSFETTPGIQGANGSQISAFSQVPNLALTERDSAGANAGWDTQDALSAFYQKLQIPGSPSPTTITENNLTFAYQAAMVPDQAERGKYNIIDDLTADPFVHNFDTLQQAAFWAPVLAPGGGDANQQLQNLLAPLFQGQAQTFVDAIKNQLTIYLGKLHHDAGEDGDGFNITRLNNPFVDKVAGMLRNGGNPQPITVAAGGRGAIAMTSSDDVKTSWNAVNDGDFRTLGRTGYSVKFVSFDSLTANKQPTDGQTAWNNSPDLDSEASADVQAIRH